MANNTIITMDSLKERSVRVYPGTIAVNPVFETEEELELSEHVLKFNGCYATNNSTVCYVIDNKIYATPYTRTKTRSLRSAGFRQDYFYVPFSNGEYPKNERTKWETLREEAHQSYEEDFAEDCVTYCDQHNIGTISEKSLQNCFEIPYTGIKVRRYNFDDCYYPIVDNYSLFTARREMGHFNNNNGKVIIVYRNGKTYLAKGYKILIELRAAGFTQADYFVPLSNGERIQDPVLKARWESL